MWAAYVHMHRDKSADVDICRALSRSEPLWFRQEALFVIVITAEAEAMLIIVIPAKAGIQLCGFKG